jgi:hypothetical protein
MVVSRRSFMKNGTLLILAAGASLGEAKSVFGRDSVDRDVTRPGKLPLPNQDKLAALQFTKATFEPFVNTVFLIFDGTKVVKSTLVSVADIGPVPDQKSAGRECFVIKFKGTRPLAQKTYRIEHNALGKFELFLVPAGKDRKGSYYQAVINRLNA